MSPVTRIVNLATKRVGILGCGNIGEALLRNIRQHSFKEIWTSNRNEERRSILNKTYGVNTIQNYRERVPTTDVLFLCVKPNQMSEVCTSLHDVLSKQTVVISVAAGISHQKLSSWLQQPTIVTQSNQPVIRGMPNLPIAIGQGVMTFHPNSAVNFEQRVLVRAIMQHMTQFWAKTSDSEEDIDAITAISGCGPAFTAYFIEVLMQCARDYDLSPELTRQLILSTVGGTATLLAQQKMDCKTLIDQVSSRGGATEAGMKILKNSEFEDILRMTVLAAYSRIQNLSK